MQNLEQTYEKWRKMLLRTNIYLVLIIFVVEFFMYFILKKSTLITQPVYTYLNYYLILPTIEDFSIILIGLVVQKKIPPSSRLINYLPSVQLSFICLVVACTHFIYSVTLCIFCIPLFTTAIFSDKKLTLRVSWLCYFFLALTLLHRRFSPYRLINDRYFFTEAIVAFTILTVTVFICRVLTIFHEEKNAIIEAGYQRHLQMQDQLNKDQKTGLYGHNIFMNTADKAVELSEHTNNAIALAIIDIDDFKKVNDAYGHLQGDKVILKLSELLKRNYNKNLFVARFGGEEFAILFTGSEADNAIDFSENLRKDFEEQNYNFTSDAITISIGIAFWKQGLSAEDLFNNADVAMYASKDSGKNQTKVYEY